MKNIFVVIRIVFYFSFIKRRTVLKKEIELPNGNRIFSDKRILLPFSIGDYHDFVKKRVLNIIKYDIIIGEYWMQKNKTVFDY
jgi:hypothetical protein